MKLSIWHIHWPILQMDLGIAQTFLDATWMNIDIWHKELTFGNGIILQMAFHTMTYICLSMFSCQHWLLLIYCKRNSIQIKYCFYLKLQVTIKINRYDSHLPVLLEKSYADTISCQQHLQKHWNHIYTSCHNNDSPFLHAKFQP